MEIVPPLLGRLAKKKLKLNWHSIFLVSKMETLSDVLKRHEKLFNRGLGTIKSFKADIKLQDGAKPVFCQPGQYPMPYAKRLMKN